MLYNISPHAYPDTQKEKNKQNVNKSTFVLEDVIDCGGWGRGGIRSFYNQKEEKPKVVLH